MLRGDVRAPDVRREDQRRVEPGRDPVELTRDRAKRLSFDGASSRDNPQNKSRPSRARERAKSRLTYACPKGTVGGEKDYFQ